MLMPAQDLVQKPLLRAAESGSGAPSGCGHTNLVGQAKRRDE